MIGRAADRLSHIRVVRYNRIALVALVALVTAAPGPNEASAQIPFGGEVRQLVTFSFLPGRSGEALAIYQEDVIPLYRQDEAMRSFRALREVESPVPLDLIVISSFDGMSGMDESNAALQRVASQAGTSIGTLYGSIGALSRSHHDQFIEMLPALGHGDPTDQPLVALVWYRTTPDPADRFQRVLVDEVVPFERDADIIASTGRFLVSDGWHYLRILGFDSLGAYQEYWQTLRQTNGGRGLDAITAERRQVILAPVDALRVR